jgi:transketolase
MPSWALFADQGTDVQAQVLPPGVPRVSIEAGRTLGWQRWVGLEGASVGIDRFGASADHKTLAGRLGFTVENVVRTVQSVL